MSELALSYYQERTERLGIDVVPTILSGRPMLLLGDDHEQRLSLQRPDPERLEAVTLRYAEILNSTKPFVLESFKRIRDDNETPMGSANGRLKLVNNRHIGTIIENKLFPGHLKAGHVKGIQLEAIAPSEADPATIQRAGEPTGYFRNDRDLDINVYLRMSASLYAGRPLGYAACLTIVSAEYGWSRENRTAVVPKYMGAAYKTNDLLAKSSIDQSRANCTYIDMWGISRPLVQDVRRGVRQHGKR